jgi:phospholipase/lecithinase/hemolysin
MGVEAIPTATDNDCVTNEDANLVANMIRDDAGHGADTGSQPLLADIYTFGDSLSDVGTLYHLTGGQVPPYPYWQGRASNGPI